MRIQECEISWVGRDKGSSLRAWGALSLSGVWFVVAETRLLYQLAVVGLEMLVIHHFIPRQLGYSKLSTACNEFWSTQPLPLAFSCLKSRPKVDFLLV